MHLHHQYTPGSKSKLLEKYKKRYCNLVRAQKLAHIGSRELDLNSKTLFASEETYKIFGISYEQFDGTVSGFLKYVHPEDKQMMMGILDNRFHKEPFEMEFRIIKPDGSVRNLHQLVGFSFDKSGKPAFLYGTLQDVTEKKEMESKLRVSQQAAIHAEKRFQALVQNSGDVFEIIAPDGTILYVSPAIENIFGFKAEELIGRNFNYFLAEDIKEDIDRLINVALSQPGKLIKEDIFVKLITGEERYLDATLSNQLSNPSVQGIVINWRDVTRRVEIERRMAYLATHDELTGLPNRISLNHHLEAKISSAGRKLSAFAVVMLTFDGVKSIGDTLGYHYGEQLMIQIGDRLRASLKEQRLFRYSEMEFAIVVSDIFKQDYKSVLRGIIDLFQQPLKVDKYDLFVSVNIGISLYPRDAEDPDLLVKNANIALLRARQEGYNNYKFYSSGSEVSYYKKFVLGHDLRKSIDKQQLRVYFQPIVNLKTEEILAAEVLIRWEHPVWGLLSPAAFISLAEETGFIIDIGKWMLHEVCRAYKEWRETGLPPIKISMNYSSIQFLERNFAGNIKSIIEEYELDPHFLIVEITESILMKNQEKVISDIASLKAYGIQVALDDFGSGFSSLAYLKLFNIDIIKIDQGFVKDMLADETTAIIISNVISLAKKLRIKLVAEGIETAEQSSYLRKLNCYAGQGYLYSRPVPMGKFAGLLAESKDLFKDSNV